VAAVGGAVLLAVLLASVFVPLPDGGIRKEKFQSLSITDRRGVLLRQSLNDEEGRGQWMPLAAIAPSLRQATIAVEDKRFFVHPGVDPIAVVRSLVVNLRSMSFASGGSTITQQVVRNLYPRPRTVAAKLREAWYALRLERMSSKDDILEQYLNRVSYGNNLRGAEAASQFYFHKHALDLSLAESALLAGLPNAPTLLDPYTRRAAAEARKAIVLRRMVDQNVISREEYDRAAAQPLQLQPRAAVFRAPHVCEMIVQQYRSMNVAAVTTTIDEALQERITPIIGSHLHRLAKKNVTNAAVIVIENATGAIRVLIGSGDYFNERTSGQVNGVLALRQPGSAIKPLMYALAFDRGRSPGEIIPDLPTAIPDVRGDYVPENYDRTFHGPVSIRTALACSYNVPAVRVLESIGREPFLRQLRSLGFTSLTQTSEYYGYGLTLGNAEVSLLELTNAYHALANGGEWRPAVLVADATTSDGMPVTIPDVHPPRTVYTPEAAFLVSDILSDDAARRPAFGSAFRLPFPCAVKTGTTKDYKDNWTVGYTTRYTVGVWAGNFNGSPMQGVSGVTGAGQIFTDVMLLLHSPPYGTPPEKFPIPSGVEQRTICPRSGLPPTTVCPYRVTEWSMTKYSSSLSREHCSVHCLFTVRGEHGIPAERMYELFPPEYASWQQAEGIPVPPADAVPAGRAAAAAEPRLAIASPNNGDHFKIDPALRREYQTITIRGFFPRPAEEVRLAIDGDAGIPFSSAGYSWRLQKGVHQFQLIGMLHAHRIASTVVTITVE
jgi:penicillin-binding protein 1C